MKTIWHKYSEELPPIGIEVIAYNHKWINEDFNPNGTRVGFRTDEDDFISAYWWDYQDDYVAIAKWKCVGNPEFSDDLINSIEPEWWTYIPEFSCEDAYMTEDRYQYLNSLPLDEYDRDVSWDEQEAFLEYQHKYHPDEVMYYQGHNPD